MNYQSMELFHRAVHQRTYYCPRYKSTIVRFSVNLNTEYQKIAKNYGTSELTPLPQ